MIEPTTADTSRKRIWGLNPNVFFLGIVSLLTDISSEMIFTLVPLFLANVLGAATTIIGLIGDCLKAPMLSSGYSVAGLAIE